MNEYLIHSASRSESLKSHVGSLRSMNATDNMSPQKIDTKVFFGLEKNASMASHPMKDAQCDASIEIHQPADAAHTGLIKVSSSGSSNLTINELGGGDNFLKCGGEWSDASVASIEELDEEETAEAEIVSSRSIHPGEHATSLSCLNFAYDDEDDSKMIANDVKASFRNVIQENRNLNFDTYVADDDSSDDLSQKIERTTKFSQNASKDPSYTRDKSCSAEDQVEQQLIRIREVDYTKDDDSASLSESQEDTQLKGHQDAAIEIQYDDDEDEIDSSRSFDSRGSDLLEEEEENESDGVGYHVDDGGDIDGDIVEESDVDGRYDWHREKTDESEEMALKEELHEEDPAIAVMDSLASSGGGALAVAAAAAAPIMSEAHHVVSRNSPLSTEDRAAEQIAPLPLSRYSLKNIGSPLYVNPESESRLLPVAMTERQSTSPLNSPNLVSKSQPLRSMPPQTSTMSHFNATEFMSGGKVQISPDKYSSAKPDLVEYTSMPRGPPQVYQLSPSNDPSIPPFDEYLRTGGHIINQHHSLVRSATNYHSSSQVVGQVVNTGVAVGSQSTFNHIRTPSSANAIASANVPIMQPSYALRRHLTAPPQPLQTTTPLQTRNGMIDQVKAVCSDTVNESNHINRSSKAFGSAPKENALYKGIPEKITPEQITLTTEKSIVNASLSVGETQLVLPHARMHAIVAPSPPMLVCAPEKNTNFSIHLPSMGPHNLASLPRGSPSLSHFRLNQHRSLPPKGEVDGQNCFLGPQFKAGAFQVGVARSQTAIPTQNNAYAACRVNSERPFVEVPFLASPSSQGAPLAPKASTNTASIRKYINESSFSKPQQATESQWYQSKVTRSAPASNAVQSLPALHTKTLGSNGQSNQMSRTFTHSQAGIQAKSICQYNDEKQLSVSSLASERRWNNAQSMTLITTSNPNPVQPSPALNSKVLRSAVQLTQTTTSRTPVHPIFNTKLGEVANAIISKPFWVSQAEQPPWYLQAGFCHPLLNQYPPRSMKNGIQSSRQQNQVSRSCLEQLSIQSKGNEKNDKKMKKRRAHSKKNKLEKPENKTWNFQTFLDLLRFSRG